MIERPRGTRDFLPEEMTRRRRVEEAMRRTAVSFGYGEVRTPIFESTDLFVAKSGEAIVGEMYVFEDKGGRSISLRPELTAAVMRLYAASLTRAPKPVRVFYSGPCFRYERPQKGRYREFYQFGAELIGCPNPEGDAEIIALAVRAVGAAGLRGTEVRVGHVGALRSLLDWMGVSEDLSAAAFPLIDKGDIGALEELLMDVVPRAQLDALADYSSSEGDLEVVERARTAFAEVPGLPEALDYLAETIVQLENYEGMEVTVDLGIARGLDYYTGVVFEIDYPELGAEKQVCGGGAYELGQLFGIDEVQATGFAIGLDRVILAAEEGGHLARDEVRSGAVVIPMEREGDVMALGVRAMEALRAAGLATELEVMRRSMGKAFKAADQKGARWAVIVGSEEAAKGEVALKDLETGEQRHVAIEGLAMSVVEK
jgi:histidyl-tRNA synthetase